MKNKKKILVIGGAGYIGSHVNRELLDQGYETVVFDNLSTGSRANIFSDTRLVEGDILNSADIDGAMDQGFDAIIHLAALKNAGASMQDLESYSKNNIVGTINILNSAVKANISNIVFSSSAAVYGEPDYLPIDENHPTSPTNFYGFTKLEIERLLDWYSRLKGQNYVALRYFNAAGYDAKGRIKTMEQGSSNLLPVIMEVANGAREYIEVYGNDYPTPDGTGVRDYVHVSDLASAHHLALEYLFDQKDNLVLNLGDEKGTSVLEVLDTVRRVTKKDITSKIIARRAGDPAKLVATSGLAQSTLGWKAQHSDLETIIKTMWGVYKPL
jgi:UDP-glucose 4-epimerase